MITDKKLIQRADKVAKDAKAGTSHPDVLARVAAYQAAKDGGASDLAVQAHAKSVVQLSDALAAADVEEQPEQVARRTTKKTTAKKTTTRRRS